MNVEHVQVGAVVNMQDAKFIPFWVFGLDNDLIDNFLLLEKLSIIYAQRERDVLGGSAFLSP
jgi:hypothetical protein